MLNYMQKFLDRQLSEGCGYDKKKWEREVREGGEVCRKMSHVGRREGGNS